MKSWPRHRCWPPCGLWEERGREPAGGAPAFEPGLCASPALRPRARSLTPPSTARLSDEMPAPTLSGACEERNPWSSITDTSEPRRAAATRAATVIAEDRSNRRWLSLPGQRFFHLDFSGFFSTAPHSAQQYVFICSWFGLKTEAHSSHPLKDEL